MWLPVLETYVQTVSGSAACGRMRHKVRKTKRGKGTKIVAVTPIARLADVNLDSSDPELPSVLRSFSSGRTADVVLSDRTRGLVKLSKFVRILASWDFCLGEAGSSNHFRVSRGLAQPLVATPPSTTRHEYSP
jgi:hypothetical protein